MAIPLCLLFVEDSDNDAQLALREIRRGGYDVQYERVETIASMQAALDQEEWDLILCDYSLPSFNALKALEIMKASGKDLPFIILSGSIGEESAVTALKEGAQDFIIKGNWSRLIPAIQRELREAEIRRESKRAEAALLESETRYRSLIEQLPMIVYINSSQEKGETIYVSPQLEPLLGYTPQEWLADPTFWQKVLHPEERDRIQNEVNALGPDQSHFDREYRMLSRDGRTVWFRDQAVHVQDSQGNLSFWQGLMTDITAQKQRERELEAIAKISTALRAPQTVDDILPPLLDETLSLLGSESGSIWLYDPANEEVKPVLARGWGDRPLSKYPRGQNIPDLVVKSGEAIIGRDFRDDPRVPEEHRKNIPEGTGGACVPLRAGHRVVGVMFVNIQLPREITPDELRILNALADLGGNAIHRASLYEQTVKQVSRLDTLRAIDRIIMGSLDMRLTLGMILDQVIDQLKVDAADILLFHPESQHLEFVAGKGFFTREIENSSIRLGEGLAGKTALDKQTVHVENLDTSTPAFTRPKLKEDEKLISYYGIPLITKGRVKGILEIFHRSPLARDTEWQRFFEALGGQAAIAIDNASLFQDLQRSNMDLALAYDATIEGWSRALDLRDKETEGHTQRVTEITLKLAQAMDVSDQELVHMRRGALLHDIGKMGVPDSILLKPGKLTEEEWEVMRRHPGLAHEMLTPIAYLRPALDIPYCHHEKWDGTGYPRGLKGEQIPLAARIFSVVDVWDALSNDRPYRPAWNQEDVLNYIQEQSGTYFDPNIVRMFLRIIQP